MKKFLMFVILGLFVGGMVSAQNSNGVVKRRHVKKHVRILKGINDYLKNDLGTLVEKGKYIDCDLVWTTSEGRRVDVSDVENIPEELWYQFVAETYQFLLWEEMKVLYMSEIKLSFRWNKHKIPGDGKGIYHIYNELKIQKPNTYHGWMFYFSYNGVNYLVEMVGSGFKVYLNDSGREEGLYAYTNTPSLQMTIEERLALVDYLLGLLK